MGKFVGDRVGFVRGNGTNWYKQNIGDYLRKTVHLTMLQDGAFHRMLEEYYLKEKPLPLDRKLLYARVRAHTTEEKWAVDSILAEFFRETKRGFSNKRCEEEIHNYHLRTKSAQTNGLRGGRPKTHPVPVRLPLANPTESSLEARSKNLEARENQEKDKKLSPPPKLTDTEAFARKSFERFWVVYPKQIDRDICFRLWLTLGAIDQDKAAESVAAWLKSESWSETKYIPNPETFIVRRRWESTPAVPVNLADRKRELEAQFGPASR